MLDGIDWRNPVSHLAPRRSPAEPVANSFTLWLSNVRALAMWDNRARDAGPENLPADIAALQAGLVAERAKRIEEAARAARIEQTGGGQGQGLRR